MSGHTPGPWSLPHFAKPGMNCQCGYVLTDSMLGAVCTVHASGDGDDWAAHGDNPKFAEAVANARLIAAAPELLEALLAIESAAMNDNQCDADTPTFKAIDAARAAIAKATGEIV